MFCEKTGTPEAIKCTKCGSFFNKSFGVCPFCGYVYAEDSSVIVEAVSNTIDSNEIAEIAQTIPSAKTCVTADTMETPISPLPITSPTATGLTSSTTLSDNNANQSPTKEPLISSYVNPNPLCYSSVSKSDKAKNNYINGGNKAFLVIELVCFGVALLVAWLAPWMSVDTESNLIKLFSYDKIGCLNYLETPASVLNSKIYEANVMTWCCITAQVLMLVAIAIIIIYAIVSFTKKERLHPKGTFFMWTTVVASGLIEIYRVSINSELANIGFSKLYDFGSTFVSLIVIAIVIVGRVFGALYHKYNWED